MGSEKQISPGPGGLEKKPGHREVAEEGPPAPRTQEQRHLAESGKKQDQARSGSSSGVLPSWAPAVYEESQPQGADKEIEDQQATQQSPRTVEEGQATESCQDHTCQPTPGHQEGNGADTVQLTETCCTVDSCGQQLGGQVPKETGAPQTRPRETRSEPEPAEQEDGSHEDMLTAMQREDIDDFLPSFVPASKLYKERGETVEAQRTQGAVSPPEIRKTEEWRLLNSSQKQPQQPVLASTAQSLKSTYQGFMKCLLEVEEEEALIRRAAKARVLHNRKSPRTLTPVPIPTAAANSTPCLTQSHNSSSATSWGRQPSPVSVVSPSVAIPAPASMSVSFPDWRRIEFLNQNSERNLGCTKARPEMDGSNLLKLFQNWKEKSEEHLTLKQEEAFRSYFDIFKGHGEVDARSLENTLLFVGISLMPAQVEAALMSADIDGDGHVSFKDFLAVMTDTKRFFCSVEQNTLTDMTPSNPHTLFFEILSLLVEMLALPETALEEITTYYQKKLKEGTTKVQEIESTIGRLRARKKPPYPQQQQAENLDVPERRVLRILSKLKQQNYGDNLQSPYAQVPCIPLCPRLDKKMICRRQQGNHYVLDQYTPTYLGPDIRSLFCQPGSQGNREHSTDGRKWFGSVLARTH